jgi:excisionase family DNA binding protein
MTTAADRDVMTTQEVADLLRFNDETVRQLAKAGRIPAAKIGAPGSRGHWRFSRRTLEGWLKAGAPADGGKV